MADDLGKLSPEQVKKLAGVISEAKGLTNQQAEIIERVLAGETDIGKLRISYLKEYFDIYSRNLDMIARKQSALNDAFLVLDKQLTDSYKKLPRRDAKDTRDTDDDIQKSSNKTPKVKAKKTNVTKEEPEVDAPKETKKPSKKPVKKATKEEPETTESEETKQGQTKAKNKKERKNFNRVSDEKLQELDNYSDPDFGDSDAKKRADQFAKFFQKNEEERRNTIISEQAYLDAIEQRRQEHKIKQLREHAEQIKKIDQSIMDLELKRHKSESDWQNQVTELRLKRVQDSIKAEDEAQTLINKITAELAYASGENLVQNLEQEQEPTKSTEPKKVKTATEATDATDKSNKVSQEATESAIAEFITTDLTQMFKQLGNDDESTTKKVAGQELTSATETKAPEASTNMSAFLDSGILLYGQKNQESAATTETEAKEPSSNLPAYVGNDIKQYGHKDSDNTTDDQKDSGISTAIKFITASEEAAMKNKKGPDVTEAGETRARESSAKDKLKAAQAFEDSINKYRAKKELEAKRKNNGILSKEESSRIEKEIAKKFNIEKLNDKKRLEARFKLESEQENKKARKELSQGVNDTFGAGKSFAERKEALYNLTHDESGEKDTGKAISAALVAVSDLATQLEKKIDEIASYKGAIDTRLQGSTSNVKSNGSYWDQLVKDMTSVGAINPYFKQETFANNIKTLVEKGISFDLKQRAFLMTIQEKIANTFDVADGTLLRLIRIQQQDSTAGRLGMESALNSFLNEMYETSEYLTQIADSVRGSLEEMQSLMNGAEAAEVEYQVQKWLGSLYSVGMSQSAVQSISTALGQIAAGQIEGLTSGGASNLLIMAANEAGLSIADILTGGINANETDELLASAVDYLAELASSAKDNRVIQQQLADVFGVKASDLRAATNLSSSSAAVKSADLGYGAMVNQLYAMAGTMGQRTSMAEMMTNFWENGQYTLAGSMASNPVSYFIYKMAKVVDDAAGGIDLPFINVMGFGVDLNTTVSDLMRVAAVGAGILGSIGPLVSGLGNSFSGQSMLKQLGITNSANLEVTARGSGLNLNRGTSTSESGHVSKYAGNASGSDIKDSTIQEANDSKKQQMIEAKEEAESNQVDVLNTTVLKIFELLDDVANGDKSLRVRVDTYGLTRAGSGTNSTGAIGGVAGLGGSSGSSSGSGSGSGSVSSGSIGGNVNLGGWTIG